MTSTDVANTKQETFTNQPANSGEEKVFKRFNHMFNITNL